MTTYEAHRETITTINQRLQKANQGINVAKERAATASLAVLAADLARLKAVKARHTPQTAALCDDYLRERAAKEATEGLREQARADLERHRTTVFPGLRRLSTVSRARRLLRSAAARIDRRPRRLHPPLNVLINNTPVPIGGADPALGGTSPFATPSAPVIATLWRWPSSSRHSTRNRGW